MTAMKENWMLCHGSGEVLVNGQGRENNYQSCSNEVRSEFARKRFDILGTDGLSTKKISSSQGIVNVDLGDSSITLKAAI